MRRGKNGGALERGRTKDLGKRSSAAEDEAGGSTARRKRTRFERKPKPRKSVLVGAELPYEATAACKVLVVLAYSK